MNNEIYGINKLKVVALADTDNGKTVTVSSNGKTWTATIADKKAEFLIPSMPTPARKDYTISFGDYRKTISLGYGDSLTVTLAEGYDPIKGVDLLTLDSILEASDLKYKGAAASSVKDLAGAVSESLSTETADGTVVSFKFGIDSAGRYGYVKAGADSVTPFKDGSESFCYYMGEYTETDKTFNAKNACQSIKNTYGIDIDYTKLTTDNFVCMPKRNTNNNGVWTSAATAYMDGRLAGYSDYYPPEVAYSQSTGIVTISRSGHIGNARIMYDSGEVTSIGGKPQIIPTKIYLVRPLNG